MSTYQIRVKRSPADQVKFIKALRLVARMSLKQAQDLAMHLGKFQNSVVVAGVDARVAEHLESVFQDAGAEVTLEPSSVDTPMLCTPEVNTKYQWGMFRVIEKAG